MLQCSQMCNTHSIMFSCSSRWWVGVWTSAPQTSDQQNSGDTSHCKLHFFFFSILQVFTYIFFPYSSQLTIQAFFIQACIHFYLILFTCIFGLFLHESLGNRLLNLNSAVALAAKSTLEKKKRAQDTLSIIHSEIMTEKRQEWAE